MDAGPFRRVEKVSQPLKGSFPLDHEADCKLEMIKYMICLSENKSRNTECRAKAQAYFECRMTNGLMDRDEWKTLGYADTPVVNEAQLKETPKQ
uniref:CHCH domain-containing protein n=1 Tax=Rhabditophanes sp. KR3021 TaxID=114890 RepID=A0AC35TSS8_9BILA